MSPRLGARQRGLKTYVIQARQLPSKELKENRVVIGRYQLSSKKRIVTDKIGSLVMRSCSPRTRRPVGELTGSSGIASIRFPWPCRVNIPSVSCLRGGLKSAARDAPSLFRTWADARRYRQMVFTEVCTLVLKDRTKPWI